MPQLDQRSDPRRAKARAAENVSRGGRRQQSTSRQERFREAFALTVGQVETAIHEADCLQLARALDPYGFVNPEVTFRCPSCDAKQAAAISRWRWRCGDCDHHGTWVALRHLVALDVEATCRLATIVHGVKVEHPARGAA